MKSSNKSIDIVEIDKELKLYALRENNMLVHDIDAVKFKLERQQKIELIVKLKLICNDLIINGKSILNNYIRKGILKKIIHNKKAEKFNLWEVRSPAHGGRIFFIIDNSENIVVSAVDKAFSIITKPQERAIQRGIKRWETYLKK